MLLSVIVQNANILGLVLIQLRLLNVQIKNVRLGHGIIQKR